MFDRKRPAAEEAPELVDAQKYKFAERPDFPRNYHVNEIDEYFVPSRKIVINKYGAFKSDEARNIDSGVRTTHEDGRQETTGVLESSAITYVKLSKVLVDQAEIVANANDLLTKASEKLDDMQEFRDLMADEKYFAPRKK